MHGLCVLLEAKAALGDAGGEAEVWQRGCDDVEGGEGGICGLGEKREDFGGFEEGAGPAVEEEERDGIGSGRAGVEKVDV